MAEEHASPSGSEAKQAQAVERPYKRLFADFVESRLAMIGLIVLVLLCLIALLAPVISPQNPYDQAQLNLLDSELPPGGVGMDGTTYVLGTDGQGRDMLSAIFYGLRISLGIGLASGLVAFTIGLMVGISAAYFGGRFDTLVMRIVDIQLGFPAILIALVLLAVVGRGVDKVVIALVASQWVYFARAARGAGIANSKMEYIAAARCLALSTPRVLFRHLLPNCLPPLIVVCTVQVGNAIALEATLSFLGVGLPVTKPSLGLLIANGYQYMLSDMQWISFYPGIALLITIVSINLVADQLREALNPRSQE